MRWIFVPACQVKWEEKKGDAIRTVNQKFCLDPELLESALALGLLPTAKNYKHLEGQELHELRDKEEQERQNTIRTTNLDRILESYRKTDMKITPATWLKPLFISYHINLRRNGISWVLKGKQKNMEVLRPQSF